MTEKEKNLFYARLGMNIRNARLAKKISQDNLAKMLKLSRPSIVNIEKARQSPSIHTLVEITNYLDVSILELLPKNDNNNQSKVNNYDKKIEEYENFIEPDNPSEFQESIKDFLRKNLESGNE